MKDNRISGGSSWLLALRAAFPHTIPIMTGFLFLGITYGVLATQSGLPFWMPTVTSIFVFGGSLEFVGVSLLTGAFDPISAFVMALLIQARHLFYGIAMLEKYKNSGAKKFYLIYALCDETFSVNCATEVPANIDAHKFYFCTSILDQLYWITGVTTGAIFGSIIPFNTTGLDFAMTALFVVIFINQWQKDRQHISALIGAVATVACLLIFGSGSFLLPSMGLILLSLTLFRKPIEKGGAGL